MKPLTTGATCGRTGASFDATCDSKGKLAAGELGVTR